MVWLKYITAATIRACRYYVRKNRQKAKQILKNFLKVEVRLALLIALEGWDFTTYFYLLSLSRACVLIALVVQNLCARMLAVGCVHTPCTGLLCSCSDTRFLVINILGARPEDRVWSIYCQTLSFDHAGAMHVKQDALSDLITPWLIFYALAVVVSLLAVFIKLKVFYRQLRYGPQFGKKRHKSTCLAQKTLI